MRRWNGWGKEGITYPLPPHALETLDRHLGKVNPSSDASLEAALNAIPTSRARGHPLVTTEPIERLRHARGQSLPDWIALRSGRVASFPDGIAYPTSDEEIRSLIGYAKENQLILIPYGGGTSVLGHINAPGDGIPSLILDMSRLNHGLAIDSISHLGTFEAGVCGPDLERFLSLQGFTLGHFPQSFEYSTLGGWIATRSCGQQSHYYGRIEDNFIGGHIETPIGPLDFPPFPASAAGPDLKQLFLGSEGRCGILTRAVMRIRPLPEVESFFGLFFPDWESGVEAVKSLAQADVSTSMLRLSDSQETEITMTFAGKASLTNVANRGLSLLGIRDQRCLLILGITGDRARAISSRKLALRICRNHGGIFTGSIIGRIWKKTRFTTPYLRNTLWDHGYALDTLETAVPWVNLRKMHSRVNAAITQACEDAGTRVLVFAHVSHVYHTGASLYFTYLYGRSPDPDQTLERWNRMKQAACEAILDSGGTISHQHGIGRDHAPYLEREKGPLGMKILDCVSGFCDPDAIMNPDVLISKRRQAFLEES